MRYDVRESHYHQCSRRESNIHIYSNDNESQANEECSLNIATDFDITDIDYFENSAENYFSFNECETVTEFQNLSRIAGYEAGFYCQCVPNDVFWPHCSHHPSWYQETFTSHINSYNQRHIGVFKTFSNVCDQENYTCNECGCPLIHSPGYMHENSHNWIHPTNQSQSCCYRENLAGPQMTIEKIYSNLSYTPYDHKSSYPNEENFIWHQVPRSSQSNHNNQECYYNLDYDNSSFQNDDFEEFVTWFKDVSPTQDQKQFHVWVCNTPTQRRNQEYEEFQVVMEDSA